ncbi:hypothetical protein FB567DRAFT_620545 [Paraphoma chrysanthemicola]|uniref:Uncharacterized protein n=1 Tax=Paraphoma chrysanthemicola TaxID=798071 RepID=A0A8K0R757_9PLEO|nr:hypothetical protein FB567DRAFT_620545 [Paraphoma chrysanthemicola]
MAAEPRVSDAQQVLLRNWAVDTNFELDIYDTPKRQFNVLAKLQGWEGGSEPWNANWLECFGEEYIWRAGMTIRPLPKTRRVFSENAAMTSENATPVPSDDGGSVSEEDHGTGSDIGGGVWYQFKGFKPDPNAPFRQEFWRLSLHLQHRGWTREEIREQRAILFEGDFDETFGTDFGSLADWQEFCRICSIVPVPDTIPECVEALTDVLVNIYDVLDHKRTKKEKPLIPFDDFEEFKAYTLKGRTYPCEKAKADTFLIVFLKELLIEHQYD